MTKPLKSSGAEGDRTPGLWRWPAGFNAEFTKRGGRTVSVDPLYAFSTEQIRNRISETRETVIAQPRLNHANYIWSSIASVEELGRVRMSAMDLFLVDYDTGKRSGRYVAGELPLLPFESTENHQI